MGSQVGIKLDEEITGAAADGVIVCVQRWSGFLRGKCAVVVSHDGRVTFERSGGSRKVATLFRSFGLGDGVVFVPPAQARALLAGRGKDPGHCQQAGCGTPMPIGGPWCTACGKKKE